MPLSVLQSKNHEAGERDVGSQVAIGVTAVTQSNGRNGFIYSQRQVSETGSLFLVGWLKILLQVPRITWRPSILFYPLIKMIDLKVISKSISTPPFNKSWSIIQLHDELEPDVLLATIYEVAAHIDEANKPSVFQQDREHEEKIIRLVEFLRMLKFEAAVENM